MVRAAPPGTEHTVPLHPAFLDHHYGLKLNLYLLQADTLEAMNDNAIALSVEAGRAVLGFV